MNDTILSLSGLAIINGDMPFQHKCELAINPSRESVSLLWAASFKDVLANWRFVKPKGVIAGKCEPEKIREFCTRNFIPLSVRDEVWLFFKPG